MTKHGKLTEDFLGYKAGDEVWVSDEFFALAKGPEDEHWGYLMSTTEVPFDGTETDVEDDAFNAVFRLVMAGMKIPTGVEVLK
jgi:hypothetical protein